MRGKFSFFVPITKIYEEEGARFFEGVASDTRVDRQHQKLSPEAIRKIANQAQEHQIGCKAEHEDGWTDEFAYVVKTDVLPDGSFYFKARLEDGHPEGELVWKKLSAGKQVGASIEGRLLKAHIEYDEEAGEYVEVIDDMDLTGLVITPYPANPRTWVNCVWKALADDGKEGAESGLETELAQLKKSLEVLRHENTLISKEIAKLREELESVPVRKGYAFVTTEKFEDRELLSSDEYRKATPEEQLEMIREEIRRRLGGE